MRSRGYIICGFTSSLFESALTNESMGQSEPKCQKSELKGKAKTSQNLRALTGSERMGWRVQADSIITSDQTTEITGKRPDSPTLLLREWTSLTGRLSWREASTSPPLWALTRKAFLRLGMWGQQYFIDLSSALMLNEPLHVSNIPRQPAGKAAETSKLSLF